MYAQPVFATIEDNLLALLPALDKLGNKDWILRLVYRWVKAVEGRATSPGCQQG